MLKRLGAAFFDYNQCAIQMEIDEIDFRNEMRNRKSDCFKAYYAGYLGRLLELREADAENAIRGSNPALQSLIRAAQDTAVKNI
jgi:hypothetical protein